MSDPNAFPPPDHNHSTCVDLALDRAEALCRSQGARLTAQRRRVLELVWESHRPIGAYEILDRLAAQGTRPAPMTVYRALDFLQTQGLIHRLARLNAFIGCEHPQAPHSGQFLICRACKAVAEIHDPEMEQAMRQSAAATGFSLTQGTLELEGVCAHCQGASHES